MSNITMTKAQALALWNIAVDEQPDTLIVLLDVDQYNTLHVGTRPFAFNREGCYDTFSLPIRGGFTKNPRAKAPAPVQAAEAVSDGSGES